MKAQLILAVAWALVGAVSETLAQGTAFFVAQEVERVFPNWVQEVPGAEHDASLTPDGRVKSLSLPFEFDALTVEALRELRAENMELKKSVAELKEMISKLAAQ